MTTEEIERTLQTVASGQADHDARLIRVEEAFQQISLAIKQLTELAANTDSRIDSIEETAIHTDARLDALITAQVKYEARQERLEEAFRQVAESHQTLVHLASVHEERLDGHDEANVHTDNRLDALIDAQIGLDDRLAKLSAAQAEYRKQAEERGARLDEKLAQLTAAQARTDEQIKELLIRNGSTQGTSAQKPKARAKKTAKKGRAK